MYQALYRVYRPEVFSEVIGQDHIVKILKNQIEQDSVSHAYLFCGTRGTGKTTTARLLAKGVNCLSDGERPCGECENCRAIKAGTFVDLIEIDAASNNGVDSIRELRESVNYPPAVGRKKVYIIDEVHMLSTPAFNALLKTLEEPPGSVMFILCTTEPEKLPATVLSRCMRMDFRRVSEDVLLKRLQDICRDRNAKIDDEALRLIAVNADGSARDGLTLLDQCIAGRQGEISKDDVLESLGAVDVGTYIDLTQKVTERDVPGGLLIIDRIIKAGRDARQILQGWMSHYRDLMMAEFMEDPQDMIGMSGENAARVSAQAAYVDPGAINNAIIELSKTIAMAKASTQPRVLLEMCFVRLASYSPDGEQVVLKAAPRIKAQAAPAAQAVRETGTQIEADGMPAAETEQGSTPEEADVLQSEETPKKAEAPKPEAADEMDIASVWKDVVREAIERSDDHAMGFLKSTKVLSMDDRVLKVEASTMAANVIDSSRAFIENIFAQHAGIRRKIETEKPGKDGKKKADEISEDDLRNAASSAEDFLGVKVDVE